MLLASCGTEIKFHKWPSGDYAGSYQIPEAGFYIPSISWCSEGELLVTTVPSLGPPIIISVAESGIQTYQIVDVTQVQSATFSRTLQKNIAFGTENGQVLIYDIKQKRTLHQLPLLPAAVKYLQYGAQDEMLAAGCKNGQICLYNSKHNVCSTFYVPNSNSLTAMSCHSRLPHLLAAASIEGVVVVWDANTGHTKLLDKTHHASTTDVAFSSSEAMATVGLDAKFIGYDLRTKECTFCCKTGEKLSAVAFMPGGDNIAVGTIDGKLFCYDIRAIDHPIHTTVAHHPKAVGRIAFQSLPFCEDPSLNDSSETHQSIISNRSNLTTVVYTKEQSQSYVNNRESSESLTQHASTVNSIIPDSDSECLIPTSEEFASYLENLHYNKVMENRGDANRVLVGGDCLNLNQSQICHTIPFPQIIAAEVPDAHKTTGAFNVLNRFPFTSNRSESNKCPPVEEELAVDLEAFKNDVINMWIKRLPANSPGTMSNITAVMDQDEDIVKLRKELQDVTKESIDQLGELINREFMKIRMAVSRGFVQMECKMNARWQEFHKALLKMSGYMSSDDTNEQDTVKEPEEIANIQITSALSPTRSSHSAPKFSKTFAALD